MAAAPPLQQLLNARLAVWNATHPAARRIDPGAELGIAAHEGLSGGIGDNGTSFGPNQLHLGGAFPVWAPHQTPAQAQAWASSPAGIDYALGQVAQVAGGLRGLPAIQAITTGFERPADPAAEIQAAAAHYGLALPQLTGVGAETAASPGRPPVRPRPARRPAPVRVAASARPAARASLAAPQASAGLPAAAQATAGPQAGPQAAQAAQAAQGPSPGVLASLMMSNDSLGQGFTPQPVQTAFTPYQPLQNLLAPTQRLPYQPIVTGGR